MIRHLKRREWSAQRACYEIHHRLIVLGFTLRRWRTRV